MTAKNMSQLNAILMKELVKAMNVSSEKMLSDMYGETGGFYTGKEPKEYERTGALGDTPRVTAISSNGNTVSFKAYLDTCHQYTTGSYPNMLQVLNLANSGIPFTTASGYPARATVGKKGFWEESEKKMRETLNQTMSKFFK